MNKVIVSAIAALVCAASLALTGGGNNPTWRYTFAMSNAPGLTVQVGNLQAEPYSSDPVANGTTITASLSGCNSGPPVSIGSIYVYDSHGAPVNHDDGHGHQVNYYTISIGTGCESGSWTVNTSHNPPFDQNNQYCPCGQ